jgi:hypothetical protein
VAATVTTPIHGKPDMTRVCTSHVERQNLSIRMGMRRMTRLTNAFSKKWENLRAAYALWFALFNFCRVHKTLRVTPAMEAGIAIMCGASANYWRRIETKAIQTLKRLPPFQGATNTPVRR